MLGVARLKSRPALLIGLCLFAAAALTWARDRVAGTMGLDTTSDAESARQEVERVEKEVEALKGVPGTKVENERLEGLGREVAELKRTMGLGR